MVEGRLVKRGEAPSPQGYPGVFYLVRGRKIVKVEPEPGLLSRRRRPP